MDKIRRWLPIAAFLAALSTTATSWAQTPSAPPAANEETAASEPATLTEPAPAAEANGDEPAAAPHATETDTAAPDEGEDDDALAPGEVPVPFRDSFPEMQRVGLILILGIGVLYVGLGLYRRYAPGRVGGQLGRRVRIADTVALGGKRYLCTVEAMGRTLLIGISGDRIQLLTELGNAGGPVENAAFDQALGRALSDDSAEDEA